MIITGEENKRPEERTRFKEFMQNNDKHNNDLENRSEGNNISINTQGLRKKNKNAVQLPRSLQN